jgi:hypothetical protein
MTLLTLSATLALGGGLAAGGPVAADPQAIPDGVYVATGVGSSGRTIALDLTQGTARIVSACIPYGSATYEARSDGAWSFTVGDLSTRGCPGAAGDLASAVVDALNRGTAWSFVASTPTWFVPHYSVTGPGTQVSLVSAAQAGYEFPSPLTEPPDDPVTVTALQGAWRVESLVVTATSGAQEYGPFEWTATIDPTRVTLPKGCNTGTGEPYLATQSGAFLMDTPGMFTAMGCLSSEPNESEHLYHALVAATRWSQPGADTLAFTGPSVQITLVRPDPAGTPARPRPQSIPNGVYSIGEWAAFAGEVEAPSSVLSIALVDGTARWAGGCLSYGAASYTARSYGPWSFTPQDLSTKGCPGETANAAATAMDRLARAWAWQAMPTPGTYRLLAEPYGYLTMHHLSTPVPDAGPPDDPSAPPAMQGVWRVAAIVGGTPSAVAGPGPYGWTLTIDPTRITLPQGCNTPAGEGYVATASGVFTMRTLAMFAAVSCPGERNESENTFHTLANATRWAAPSPDTLLLAGPGTEVFLERAAPTNHAFAVKAIRPAQTTVRLAVGQSVKLPVTAEPIGPRARANASVRWTTSRGAVARIATGAVSTKTLAKATKATKAGTLKVPMSTGKAATLTIAGVKKGTSRLTLTAASGVKTTVKIVVTAKRVAPTKVTITGGTKAWSVPNLRPQLQLRATVRPAKATAAVPRWSSSDPTIATVDAHGLVTVAPDAWHAASGKKVTITVKAGTRKATRTLTVP